MAPTDAGPAGNDILLTLNGINRGRLASEAGDKLDDLVAAVTRYEKTGTLAITLKVEPGREEGTVNITASVVVKAPQPEHPGTFFVAEGKRLTREDPAADPLFTRESLENGERN